MTNDGMKQINISDAEFDTAQLKRMLIDGLVGDKDSMELVKELAAGLFPNEDLESKAIMKKMANEVEEFATQTKGLNVEDYYLEPDFNNKPWYEFYFEVDTPARFMELHPTLTSSVNYLMATYKTNVSFNYRIQESKSYKEEFKENGGELEAKKPEIPASSLFDIEFNEVV